MCRPALCLAVVLAAALPPLSTAQAGETAAWTRHTIDASSRGADGTRLADVNGDRLPDIVTGWEQGGLIRVYLNPGPDRAAGAWPAVTVGRVRSPEDAVFVDLDGDGATDVVSSCEGRERTLFVHWAPSEQSQYLDEERWTTEPLPGSKDVTAWMFCLPLNVDGRRGIDLVCGSKGNDGRIVWWESPENPRDLHAWKAHPLVEAGWIMSLAARDFDADGDLDLLYSDRKGRRRGIYWAENRVPSAGVEPAGWPAHAIGGQDREVMFLAHEDLAQNGTPDVVAAVHRGPLLFLRETIAGDVAAWVPTEIPLPEEAGGGKSVAVGDIDLDGRRDIVFSCEGAERKSGVMWLSSDPALPIERTRWTPHDISGTAEGVKFDLVELLDLDADGDLDVLTCEERDNLGVIWYENPTRRGSSAGGR
ncbi:MAG: VCBS repeat-containing protein [Planctomycetes bacterium]|nr:VCBS repeat-containing protein [Planctomycetota bacterium]